MDLPYQFIHQLLQGQELYLQPNHLIALTPVVKAFRLFGLVEAVAVQEAQVAMVHLGQGQDMEAQEDQGFTTATELYGRITTAVAVVAQADQLTQEVLVGLR